MTVIADRYELGPVLGSGGMARVLQATDRVLERRVAIKMLREDFDPSGVMAQRFVREARLAGSLSHPAIVQVYDAGVHEGAPWMAMELVPGPTLSERQRELGRFDVDEAIAVVAPVLDGLHAAHQAGVIHRDIKPANIMLSPSGPKLADFGIAKSLMTTDLDLTAVDQFMGTPKYIAPEVALGEKASRHADLYSSAVVLWEMLAGHAPFSHEHPITLAMMHHTDPLPRIIDLRPDLPRHLVQTLEAALAKSPSGRPDTADVMRRQLLGELPPPPPATPTPATPAITAGPATPRSPAQAATRAIPRQQRPPSTAPVPRPVTRTPEPSRSGWPVAIAVGVLTLLAVIGFTLVIDGGFSPSPTPSPSLTPSTNSPTPTTAEPFVPVPPVTVTEEPEPTAAPTTPEPTQPTPEPSASESAEPSEPSETPEGAEPPQGEPTEEADPGGSGPFPVPVPGFGGDDPAGEEPAGQAEPEGQPDPDDPAL